VSGELEKLIAKPNEIFNLQSALNRICMEWNSRLVMELVKSCVVSWDWLIWAEHLRSPRHSFLGNKTLKIEKSGSTNKNRLRKTGQRAEELCVFNGEFIYLIGS